MAKFFRWRTILILLAGTILCLLAYYKLMLFLHPGFEERVSSTDYYYTIDPDTILEDMTYGNTDIFSLSVSTPEALPSTIGEPVRWTSKDYYRIAQAFSLFVWGEPIENWNLRGMDFDLLCSDVGIGLQGAHYLLFVVDKSGDRDARRVRNVVIDPRNNYIKAYQEKYYPDLQHWETADWGQVKITAEEALQIAEINGGADYRASVVDDCEIGIIIASGSLSDGWEVSYYGNKDEVSYMVDAYTGDIKK